MVMDLSKATPDERTSCFGEAFRDVQMVGLKTDATGTLFTTVILDGQTVLLVGDPEEALANYYNPFYPGQKCPCDGGGMVVWTKSQHEEALKCLNGETGKGEKP
ncbi:hypothetical protein [Polaromonas sp. JS666]|uniref:hypothetical protein n=1 Tax=Polaromonas sp. (strain JS666 / ATCC BAA-500) TaxID=296591 RepID=UPI00088C0FF9|nr:hypothetical protein [Polaromonas sp. JS666]SDN51519.1 hypothetical protein SAMN05720382_105305 [Polaromonas sp. JS666]